MIEAVIIGAVIVIGITTIEVLRVNRGINEILRELDYELEEDE